jgi:hypothetical protein
MAGDSGRVVVQRRQSRGRSVEVAAIQTEETAATNAAHADREAHQAAGASGVAKADSGTNEKRATIKVARIDGSFTALFVRIRRWPLVSSHVDGDES